MTTRVLGVGVQVVDVPKDDFLTIHQSGCRFAFSNPSTNVRLILICVFHSQRPLNIALVTYNAHKMYYGNKYQAMTGLYFTLGVSKGCSAPGAQAFNAYFQ